LQCHHTHRRAIQKSAAELDCADLPARPSRFSTRLAHRHHGAGRRNHTFCNSGSEAADSALKIALAYQRMKGQASRTRLIGRERGYHGVNFGGISVGGMAANRKMFGTMLAGVDHLPHTYNRKEQAFTKGEPDWGVHLADELERLVALHDASTIAAVIVEPMAGSTGVLAPPNYLKRLREIHDRTASS
jgi:beta-alanine--pyruvate transaminase